MTAASSLPRRLARLASRLGLTAYCERCDGSYDGAAMLGWQPGAPFPYQADVLLPHARHAGSLTPYDLTWRLRRAWVDQLRAASWQQHIDVEPAWRWAYEKRDPLLTRLAARLLPGTAGWCCRHPYADHTPWSCERRDRTGHRCHGDPANQHRAGLHAENGSPGAEHRDDR